VEERARLVGRVRLDAARDTAVAAYARIVGMLDARDYAVAMCDADDVVAAGWVAAMGDALREHELVAGRLDVHWLNPEWLVASRGLALERGPRSFGDLFEFPHACNMGLRTYVVDRFGGFDPAFTAGEEIELAFRLWQAGIRVHEAKDALVHYRYRDTARGLWRQARAYGRAQPALVAEVERAGYGVARDGEWRRWLWLARHADLLGDRAGRARWIGVAGGRVGRVEGRLDVAIRRRRAGRRREGSGRCGSCSCPVSQRVVPRAARVSSRPRSRRAATWSVRCSARRIDRVPGTSTGARSTSR
jgi:hypothetical protein